MHQANRIARLVAAGIVRAVDPNAENPDEAAGIAGFPVGFAGNVGFMGRELSAEAGSPVPLFGDRLRFGTASSGLGR